MLRIRVISDTHGLLRPEVEKTPRRRGAYRPRRRYRFAKRYRRTQRIAPVIAIRGNVDTGHWAEHYPETQKIMFGGRCIYVLHDVKTLQLDPVSSGVDVIVCGHSHRPRIETIRGVLYLNPGSAGPRRFNLPVTVATLDLTTSRLTPVIHHLGGAS